MVASPGAEVEYAYRAGYDSRGRVSVTHLVDERGYSVMLTKPEPDGPVPARTGPASEDSWGQRVRRSARMRHRHAKGENVVGWTFSPGVSFAVIHSIQPSTFNRRRVDVSETGRF